MKICEIIPVFVAWSILFTCCVPAEEPGDARSWSPSVIVVSATAPNVTRFAAEELQKHLQTICGRSIPINTGEWDPAHAGSRILIGASFLLSDKGSEAAPPVPDGFVIHRSGGDLLIGGDDRDIGGGPAFGFDPRHSRKGTLFGVCHFLETYFGMRWFWPGPSGEVAPTQETLQLPHTIHTRQAPSFLWRHHFYTTGDLQENGKREVALWYMRNRHGIAVGSPGSFAHSWAYRLGGNRLFSDHPEYYALIKGERKPFRKGADGREIAAGRQVCTSNPEVAQVFVKQITSKLQTDVDTIVNVSPNDGAGFCECYRCRSEDHPELYAPEDGYDGQVFSDRIFGFVNRMVDLTRKTHPRLKFGIFAYTFASTPPRALSHVDANVVISMTQQLSLYNNLFYKEWNRNRFQEWLQKGNRIVMRDYLGLYNFGNLMIPQSQAIHEEIRHAASYGKQLFGFYSETSAGDFVPNHLNHYILSRCLWNPGIDLTAVKEDYYRSCFGKAAPEMRIFFEQLEQYFSGRPVTEERYIHAVDQWLSDDRIADCLQHLEAAEKAVAQEETLKRVRVVRDCFQYTVAVRHFIHACKALLDAGLPVRIIGYQPARASSLPSKTELRRLLEEAQAAFQNVEKRITELEADPNVVFEASSFRRMNRIYRWEAAIKEYWELFLQADRNVMALPQEWAFKLDPDDVGIKQGWHKETFDHDNWVRLRVDEVWEKQGYGAAEFDHPEGYNGIAWYRTGGIEVPASYREGCCLLHLGAVDESCWIFVNGVPCGNYLYDEEKDPDGWKTPKVFDVSSAIRFGENNTFAVRVRDISGAGGIWRGAFLKCIINEKKQPVRHIFAESFESEDWQNFAHTSRLPLPLTTTSELASEGKQSLYIPVDHGIERAGSIRWPALPLQGGKTYVFELDYQVADIRENEGMRKKWQRRPGLPTIRFIPADADGKVVAPASEYVWVRGAFETESGKWRNLRRILKFPPETASVSLTVFLYAPGKYWLDNLVLRELE